jgi:hypothetical protein
VKGATPVPGSRGETPVLDDYQYRMVLQLQTMTRADHAEAGERAARLTHGLWRLGRLGRGAARTVRGMASAVAARKAAMEQRRTA